MDNTAVDTAQYGRERGLMTLLRPPTGWASLALLTTMLLTVAWSIKAVAWVEGLELLAPAVFGAVLTALVLARMTWMPSTLAHGWGLVLGAIATLYLGTRTLARAFPELPLADLSRFERMGLVRDAIARWIISARASEATGPESELVFVVATTFLIWLLSYVCVRFLVRYVSFWGATLPSGFALLANLYYADDSPPTFLALFLLCALLLAVRTSVTLNEDYWRRARIPFSPDIGLDFLKDGVVIVVAVLAIGWLAPAEVRSAQLSSVVTTVTRSSTDLQTEINRLFPSLNVPVRGSGGGYTDTMPLTGAISLGTVPIFDARVDGDLVPRYFRMTIFDTYDGSGWRRTEDRTVTVDGEPISDGAAATVPVTQTFETFQATTSQLFAAPQPGSFSIPVRVTVGSGGQAASDVIAVEAVEPLAVGGTYQAMSRQSVADLATLRAAAAADPDWVTARYLQLPDSPELAAVADRAAEVVSGAASRYDAADRIENYLRQFPYKEQINTPPEGRDRVAWFLFEEQQGYCDYYSSAFVVMARTVGIPARVAAGYSRGQYHQPTMAYRQHAFDAHSWPEVYFPGIGWIEFEPTAQDLEIDRPEGSAGEVAEELTGENPLDRDDLLPEEDTRAANDPMDDFESGSPVVAGIQAVSWLGRLIGLITGIGVAAAVAWIAWDRPFRGLTAAEGAFGRLVRLAGWMGLRRRPSDTPFEYGRMVGANLPDARSAIDTITVAFVRERFAPGADQGDEGRLSAAWNGVRSRRIQFGAARGFGRFVRRG